jgi:hypothetical protein
MTHNSNFKFEATISRQGYLEKPTGADYATMKWVRREIALSDFIALIATGHSYCHIYHHNQRRKDKFLHTNYVSIDVDKTDVDLFQFINDCQLKPTFAYETFSNGKDGMYSYRLVFVLNEPINRNEYPLVYVKLCAMTGLTDTKDHCGKVLTQLMNGTNRNAYVYRSNIIYSPITDLHIDLDRYDKALTFKDALFTSQTLSSINNCQVSSVDSNNNFSFPYNNINIHKIYQKQYNTKEPKWKTEEHTRFLKNVEQLGAAGYLQLYKHCYQLIRWGKLDFNDKGYAVVPDGHLSLFVRYNRGKGETTINRFKDGEKRRNRLFIDGLIIRKIKPEITFYEMYFNLMHRVYYCYDNSDGVLSYLMILIKTWDVMNYDMTNVDFKTMNVGAVVTSRSYCRNHNISRRSHSRTAL